MKKLIPILALFFLVGCAKDEVESLAKTNTYPTIYPKSYYPCYPSSWWKYQVTNENGEVSEEYFSVSDEYLPHSYINLPHYYLHEGVEYTSDTVLVPFLNDEPIYGYHKIDHIHPPFGDCYRPWPIVSETVGDEFAVGFMDLRFGDFNEYLEVTSKEFDGTDSLIEVKGHWVYGMRVNHRSLRIFKKDIGLTNHYEIDSDSGDTLYKKELIEYFVNL